MVGVPILLRPPLIEDEDFPAFADVRLVAAAGVEVVHIGVRRICVTDILTVKRLLAGFALPIRVDELDRINIRLAGLVWICSVSVLDGLRHANRRAVQRDVRTQSLLKVNDNPVIFAVDQSLVRAVDLKFGVRIFPVVVLLIPYQ